MFMHVGGSGGRGVYDLAKIVKLKPIYNRLYQQLYSS